MAVHVLLLHVIMNRPRAEWVPCIVSSASLRMFSPCQQVLYFSLDVVGIGFEKVFYTEVAVEGAGTISFCIVTNVTLNGSHSASGVVKTVDVTAKGQRLLPCICKSSITDCLVYFSAFMILFSVLAGSDYLAAHEPIFVFFNFTVHCMGPVML